MVMFRTVRGMKDFLPEEAKKKRYVQKIAVELAQLYCYEEVITPIVEYYDLLAAKSGDEIRERMYNFEDFGGRKIALRPEFTASIARLIATKMAHEPKPMKLFCVGRLYRYDEPQQGRFREFWQANYEFVGSDKPESDAEILLLTNDLIERLGLKNHYLKIGHAGILRGVLSQEGVKEEQQSIIIQMLDKKRVQKALLTAEGLNVSQRGLTILEDILKMKGEDVFGILEKTENLLHDYESAVKSVENLREILTLTIDGGSKIEPWVDMGFARGLEYYTGLIFEPYVKEMEIALGGGGRYDRLVELFGGESTPALGVALGIDRLMLAMERQGISLKDREGKRVMIIPIGNELKATAIELACVVRESGIPVSIEVMGRSVSRALKDADRRNVTHSIIVGPEEIKEGKVVLRNMKKREQRTTEIESVLKHIMK